MTTTQSESIKTAFVPVVKSLRVLVLMTLVLGVAYPLIITTAANGLFPRQAQGSLLEIDGKVVGSELIGQDFGQTPYFQTRPSALATPYDAATSGGSNMSAANPKLEEAVQKRAQDWKAKTGKDTVPADLLTASASGLDPHISRAAALYQIDVVSRNSGVDKATLLQLIDKHTEHSLFGDRAFVNVLKLNRDVASARLR